MKKLSLSIVLLLACGALSAPAQSPVGREAQQNVADAKPGDVRLVVSNGLRAPLQAVRPDLEKALGHPTVIQYGTSLGLKETVERQAFEIAIVTPDVIDEMSSKEKLVAGSRLDLARVPVGIGQRGDVPKHDISTIENLKQTLLGAKSIRWATVGASLPAIRKMLGVLGIENVITPRVNMSGQVPLGTGEYELTINLASEIIPLKTQKYLGNLPSDVQIAAVMTAAIGTNGNQALAKDVMKFLQGPVMQGTLQENSGLIPVQPRQQAFKTHVLKQGRVYWVEGGGGNSGVVIGDNGVIVIDPKTTEAGGKQLIDDITTLTSKPITHVIETHSDGDHVNGISAFPAKVTVIAHINNLREQEATFQFAAVEVDGGKCVPPADRLPTSLIRQDKVTVKIDGVNLIFYHFLPAHTSGDLGVFLPDDKIAFTGDLITSTVLIHPEKGGTLEGWFRSAQELMGLDVTTYVGGHATETDTKATLQKRIDAYAADRDKVLAMMMDGKSLADIKMATGDPVKNPSGCRGIPYLPFTEIAYREQMEKNQELH